MAGSRRSKRKKLVALIAVVLIVLGLLGTLGGMMALRLYREAKEKKWMERARARVAEENWREAAMGLYTVLRQNPDHAEAHRLAAEVLTRVGSEQSLFHWGRATELATPDAATLIAYAGAAVRFAEWDTAWEALEKVSPAERENVEYLKLRADVASGRKDREVASEALARLAELAPQDRDVAVRLAASRLGGGDPAAEARARAELESLAAIEGNHRGAALEVLLGDASRRGARYKVLEYARALAESEGASVASRLRYLEILLSVSSEEGRKYLNELKEESQGRERDLAEVARWMLSVGRELELKRWLDSLPREIQMREPVQMARAECMGVMGQWKELQKFLQGCTWPAMDHLREAYIAMARRREGDQSAFRTAWQTLINAQSDNPRTLESLYSLTQLWTWTEEGEEILKIMTEKHPEEVWAWRRLAGLHHARGRTRDLLDLERKHMVFSKKDPVLKNDIAFLSFLLGGDVEEAMRLAREVYESAPENPYYASTYAFGLVTRGRAPEALRIMETLPESRLIESPRCLYHAFILGKNGRWEEANRYLARLGEKGLLPEERDLATRVRRELHDHGFKPLEGIVIPEPLLRSSSPGPTAPKTTEPAP